VIVLRGHERRLFRQGRGIPAGRAPAPL